MSAEETTALLRDQTQVYAEGWAERLIVQSRRLYGRRRQDAFCQSSSEDESAEIHRDAQQRPCKASSVEKLTTDLFYITESDSGRPDPLAGDFEPNRRSVPLSLVFSSLYAVVLFQLYLYVSWWIAFREGNSIKAWLTLTIAHASSVPLYAVAVCSVAGRRTDSCCIAVAKALTFTLVSPFFNIVPLLQLVLRLKDSAQMYRTSGRVGESARLKPTDIAVFSNLMWFVTLSCVPQTVFQISEVLKLHLQEQQWHSVLLQGAYTLQPIEDEKKADGKDLKNLHIAAVFPMKGHGGWLGGQGCLPAALMALEDVNDRKDLLIGYRLQIDWRDSQCNPGLAATVMYDLLYNPPQKLMLLGGCSIVCSTVAEAAKMWNLVVISYGSSSPALSNRNRFPTFFRTHPSATIHNPTRIKLFQKFSWTRIAIIQEAEEVFISTGEDLEAKCKEAGIEIVTRQSFLTDPTDAVKNLVRQDARIIVGMFYVAAARRVFCEAYKQNVYGKQKVWFLIGWYEDGWYAVPDKGHNCTTEQMKEALEGHFTTEALMLNQGHQETISGMSSQQFLERYEGELAKRNGANGYKPEGHQEAPLAYDAIWAIALALNKTINTLKEYSLSLEDFTYTNKRIADEIWSAMNATQFLGVSGLVAFSAKGDRMAWTLIEQMIDGNYIKIGYYDTQTDNFTILNQEKWADGKPPQDRTIIVRVHRKVSLSLFAGMCAVAFIGIVWAVGLLIFNWIFRHSRYIQLSHPMCNNIMLIGIILCLVCVCLLGLDGQFVSKDRYAQVCQARSWSLAIGFTLSFGAMFSKIWRVHRLTTKSKSESKKVQSWKLYGMVAAMVLIDVVILTAWQLVDPMKRGLETFPLEDPEVSGEDIKIEPALEHCESKNHAIWLGVMYSYKGLLLIFGIFLAYETRSVKIKQLNDSRLVGMSIYNVVVLCLITAPVTLVIGSQQDATFAFVALAIIFCSFLSMALIFVPKIIELVRRPRERADVRSLMDTITSKEEEERHQRLLAENEDLKKQIAEKEEQIHVLSQKLQERQRLANAPQSGGERVRISLPPAYADGLLAPKDPVTIDPISDSGFVTGTSLGHRGSRISHSDFEFSESYL
ncbi:gamma-aminobutyric acid type B receptor subunit 1-like isoform X2 [Ornithodoros turicata]|uniref:gamma-aminobutyric acid type B receptor subunit 1-like isoform X2 n=1 Tax=Ornithodoros turicata TaxID=34597 RepID=UPI003138EB9A